MPNCVLGIYGAGGFGREVMDMVLFKEMMVNQSTEFSEVYFIETEPKKKIVNGIKVLSEDEFNGIRSEKFFNVAVADSKKREVLANRMLSNGAKPSSIFDSLTRVSSTANLGIGPILCANSMINADSSIGDFFHLNISSYVAHDCVIGDFVTFAPNVSCNGNVHIEDHVYIGTGVTIRPGDQDKPLRIGYGAIVGMGSVVIRDVLPYEVVAGNPAKQIRLRHEL